MAFWLQGLGVTYLRAERVNTAVLIQLVYYVFVYVFYICVCLVENDHFQWLSIRLDGG